MTPLGVGMRRFPFPVPRHLVLPPRTVNIAAPARHSKIRTMDVRRGAADSRVSGRGWGLLGAVALVVVFLGAAADGGIVRYDQSQTGDYNVHVDMKNVDILAFLDDSAGFGEYEYDYGEMTLKPPSPPSTHNASLPAQAPTDASSTEKAEDSSNPPAPEGSQSTTTPPPTARPTRRCGAGFFRDPMGRCRRQRKPIRLSGILNQAKNTIGG